MEIYVHIPFCVQKCAYCDFLSFPAGQEVQRQYVDALLREIRLVAQHGLLRDGQDMICTGGETERRRGEPVWRAGQSEIRSVFIGGGTPSLLPAEWISGILQELRTCFAMGDGAEITIEANPGTVTIEKLRTYRGAGVNRISFGCQSFREEELNILGRIHTVREIRESVKLAREAGFTNINLDLMSGLPGQTLLHWEDTLRQALALGPEHISAYSLILEEGTLLFAQYAGGRPEQAFGEGENLPLLPDENTERSMYERTGEILAEAGYRQYEISNYAKEGCACRHNLGYWTGVPYLGFGLGAAGYLPQQDGGVRYRNTDDLATYLRDPVRYQMTEQLSREDLQAEYMILGLRLTEGIEDAAFMRQFGRPLEEVYGTVLDKYEKQGLLIRENGCTRLSERGISVSNPILAEFL